MGCVRTIGLVVGKCSPAAEPREVRARFLALLLPGVATPMPAIAGVRPEGDTCAK